MDIQDKYFKEWESRVFGAGYGTGELPILNAIKTFFNNIEDGRTYNFEIMEEKLGAAVFWLLVNLFYKGDVIEWGTSSRLGWLTTNGECLRDYIQNKTPEELYNICMDDSENMCLCDGEIKDKGHEDCGKNPFINNN